MVALADLLVSAALEAVIVTVCGAVIVAGAVYKPAADTVPTLGDKDQLTAVLVAPVTVAVNCWVCDSCNETAAGVRPTATGIIAEIDPPAAVISPAVPSSSASTGLLI